MTHRSHHIVEIEVIVAVGIVWISGLFAAAERTARAAVAVGIEDWHFLADGILHNVRVQVVPHDGEQGCKCATAEDELMKDQFRDGAGKHTEAHWYWTHIS